MMDFLQRLKSRKLWVTIAAIASALAMWSSNELSAKDAVWAIVTAAGAYLGVEGAADTVERLNKTKGPTVVVATHTTDE
jgi:hypothetical protein